MQNTQTVDQLKAIVAAFERQDYVDMRNKAQELLANDAANSSALYLYGMALCHLNELEEGIVALRKALELTPAANVEQQANAQLQLGTALRKFGDEKAAEQIYRKLIKQFPSQLATYGNLSFLLNEQKRYKETIRLLQPFIKRQDIDQGYIINFGNAHRGLGNLTAAKEAYTRALSIGGRWDNGALANLAMLEFHEGRLEKAKEQLLQLHAKQVCPPEGYLNLALIETDLHNPREALNWLTYVDDANFVNTSSIVNFINNKSIVNEPQDAVLRIHEWLEHHPLDISLVCAWISMGQKHCLFDELRRVEPLLLQQLNSKSKLRTEENSLFSFMAVHAVTADNLLRVAEASAQNSGKSIAQKSSFHNSPRSHPRLRIGYLSPDFRDHPVAHLMIGIFANHDREKFEVYGYNIGKEDHTVYRYRSIGYLDEFRECRELSFEELARQIHDDEIDVLVDLCGYTEHCKPKALCYKPAPVIISYLGFVGTMGLPQVDYIIADSIVMPKALEPFHTEKPIRLPRCYQATDGTLEVEHVSRKEMGLPEGAFVFVSFNNTYKLNPHFVGLWADILHRCPDAVLWLYASGVAKDNLIAEFQRLGVEPERLYFFTRQSKARFLGALALADLFLDSSPYNAGTTASDALFAGCPVLTLPGETYSSRMCASIVTHAGLPELTVDSDEAYVALACRMYADPDWRKTVRSKAEQARTSRLFDTVDATRCLEAAYRTAYDRFAAGKKPAPLTIPDPGWNGGDTLRPFAGRCIGLEEAKGIAAKLEKIGGAEAVEKLWQVLKPSKAQEVLKRVHANLSTVQASEEHAMTTVEHIPTARPPRAQEPVPSVVNRYLELLKLSLLNAIYTENDARLLYYAYSLAANKAINPNAIVHPRAVIPQIVEHIRTRKQAGEVWYFVNEKDAEGTPKRYDLRNFCDFAHTMIGKPRLDNIEQCLDHICADGIPGDLVETGVCRGGAVIFMRGYLAAHGITDRLVWCADSFEGLPAPEHPHDEGYDFTKNRYPVLAVSLEDVKENFAQYNLLDDQVRFLKGWFCDTLPTAPVEKIALLRLDGDLYVSTMDALNALYDRVSPGGFIIVDDYGTFEPCRCAIHEFREQHNIDEPLVPIDPSSVFWRKRP